MEVSLTELEQAINHWRTLKPSTGEECALSPEVNALASAYALLIYHRHAGIPLANLDPVPRQLIQSWLDEQAGQRPSQENK